MDWPEKHLWRSNPTEEPTTVLSISPEKATRNGGEAERYIPASKVREEVEIAGRGWTEAMDKACRECPRPDHDESCVECIVETACALALQRLGIEPEDS